MVKKGETGIVRESRKERGREGVELKMGMTGIRMGMMGMGMWMGMGKGMRMGTGVGMGMSF